MMEAAKLEGFTFSLLQQLLEKPLKAAQRRSSGVAPHEVMLTRLDLCTCLWPFAPKNFANALFEEFAQTAPLWNSNMEQFVKQVQGVEKQLMTAAIEREMLAGQV